MTRAKQQNPVVAPTDRRVTTGYVAEMVGMKRPAVRAWLDREEVPVTWIAGRRLYLLSDVDAVLARNTFKPVAPKGGK
jgi:hypothetical protein